jgi:hypothetical protein
LISIALFQSMAQSKMSSCAVIGTNKEHCQEPSFPTQSRPFMNHS